MDDVDDSTKQMIGSAAFEALYLSPKSPKLGANNNIFPTSPTSSQNKQAKSFVNPSEKQQYIQIRTQSNQPMLTMNDTERFGMKLIDQQQQIYNNFSQRNPHTTTTGGGGGDLSPTNRTMLSLTSSLILGSRLDAHLRESNMHYVMRRSTVNTVASNTAQNPFDQKGQVRAATQVIMPNNNPARLPGAGGGSMYKKGGSFVMGPDGTASRRPSMHHKVGSIPKFGQHLERTNDVTQNIFGNTGSGPNAGGSSSRVQDSDSSMNRSKELSHSPVANPLSPKALDNTLPHVEESEVSNYAIGEEILQTIKDNDARGFRSKLLRITNQELVEIRMMEEQLNVLQAICFYNAENLIDALKERLIGDSASSRQIVDYAEPNAGNRALHFAVLSGNIKIIDFVVKDLNADARALTANGLNALHCAAQIDRGALSLMMFTQRQYGLSPNQKDQFDCTPLHWAVTNAQFKCVECLLALGANPNYANTEGATPLHIAVQKYITMNTDRNNRQAHPSDDPEQDQYMDEEDEFLYDDLKRIMKELLFNGARRDIRARFELTNLDCIPDTEMEAGSNINFNRLSSVNKDVTPCELLNHFKSEIPDNEYRSLNVILIDQKFNQCLMTHRPLQKVEKSSQLLVTTVTLNLLIFILQILFQIHYATSDPEGYSKSLFKRWSIAANVLFVLTALCYFMCACMEPGFVTPEFDILELLRIANDQQIDLENFCFYCRVIKSGRTFHCNFCSRCVEKFDHHCSFINNCLGYRNHKYFLGFIFLYMGYFLTSTVAAIMSFSTHSSEEDSFSKNLDYVFRIASLAFNFTQLIPLGYQIREQLKKLFKPSSRFKGVRKMRGMSVISRSGSSGDSSDIGGNSIQNKKPLTRRSAAVMQSFTDVVETQAGFCYNLGQTLKYKRPTQEELRAFLFSESERFSTFVIKYHKRKDIVGNMGTSSQIEPLIMSGGEQLGRPQKINASTFLPSNAADSQILLK